MTLVIRTLERVWLPVLVIVLWWFISANSTNVYVPSLESIVDVIARDFANGALVSALLFSLQNLLYGFVIAVVVGIVLALILGETKVLFEALSPLINFIR